MDFHVSKEKTVNLFLRIIQLSLQLISGYWTTRYGDVIQCDYKIPNIISYISYGLACVNIPSLIAMQCGRRFPKLLFFIILICDCLAVIAMIVLQAQRGSSQCASVNAFQRFSIIQSANALIIIVDILVIQAVWGQRYSNAPGNIAWPILFLSYQWSADNKVVMMMIGIGGSLVCGMSIFSHVISFIKGDNSILMTSWGFGFAVLFVLEIVALLKYYLFGEYVEYIDVFAKKILTIFIVANIVDCLFWMFGFKILSGERAKEEVREEQNLRNQQQNIRKNRTSKLITEQSVLVANKI